MKRILLYLILVYRRLWSSKRPNQCRFDPSCSVYTYEAIYRYGVFLGCGLGLWRILRCNPFGKGGRDPLF
ncbi:MAG: membrane protein insertion efficiency factor YidD [Ruminococcaceae bacterium]|nr:membrane protein insertion efficiency factor YidD [Oscillospiraceae bacterium]